MKVFQELGDRVERTWSADNYDEDVFPKIAATALTDANLPGRLPVWDVVEWALGETQLPVQRDVPARFGDPPVTVYNSARFYIDVYFWLHSTTALHQHGFCGAFQVFHGSSLHGHYEFELSERINDHAEIGELSLKKCALLKVGDVKQITAGRSYIHSLFHLDHPSATIVVRNIGSPRHQPQFSYQKPSLAIDPFFEDPNTIKKLQCLTALERSRHPDTDTFISRWLEIADFQTTFGILEAVRGLVAPDGIEQLFDMSGSNTRFAQFLDAARSHHGERALVFPKVFAEQARIEALVRQRSYVTHPEHRFFLALLMNVDDRKQLFALVKERFAEVDPLGKVLDWVMDLAQTKVAGAATTNALGVADFDTLDLIVLENLLSDVAEDEMPRALRAEHEGKGLDELLQSLDTRIERIRSAGIFQPLLRRGE